VRATESASRLRSGTVANLTPRRRAERREYDRPGQARELRAWSWNGWGARRTRTRSSPAASTRRPSRSCASSSSGTAATCGLRMKLADALVLAGREHEAAPCCSSWPTPWPPKARPPRASRSSRRSRGSIRAARTSSSSSPISSRPRSDGRGAGTPRARRRGLRAAELGGEHVLPGAVCRPAHLQRRGAHRGGARRELGAATRQEEAPPPAAEEEPITVERSRSRSST
jgi:hypothetical protein